MDELALDDRFLVSGGGFLVSDNEVWCSTITGRESVLPAKLMAPMGILVLRLRMSLNFT